MMTKRKPLRWGALALAVAALAGCATTENALKDANTLMQEREADKLLPVTNLSPYALALGRFGRMLDIYKEGDPVIYMQTRSILDATNLSSPLVGAEIPGDITEMVRTAVNRIGARVVYVPYHPDYLVSQAQLGAKFGVTMPDFLITGALTEFDRAIAGAGRVNSAGIEFVGPSSILLALAASGLNGQSFAFHGYLPQDAAARANRLRELERTASATGQSQWWIETPYRNQAMLQHAVQVLRPNTLLCLASGLTLPQGRIATRSVQAWRQQDLAACVDKLPAIFGLA